MQRSQGLEVFRHLSEQKCSISLFILLLQNWSTASANVANRADVVAVLFTGDGDGTGESDTELTVLVVRTGLHADTLKEFAVAIGDATSRKELFTRFFAGTFRDEAFTNIGCNFFRTCCLFDD